MSIKEIKENLKKNIDDLSASETRLAVKDLSVYFEYLHERRQMPTKARLDFEQYQQFKRSLQQAEKGKVISARKVFAEVRKKYGFNNKGN